MRYRPAPANDKASSVPRTLCNIVVMEYLDKGNLLQVRLGTLLLLGTARFGHGNQARQLGGEGAEWSRYASQSCCCHTFKV